VASKGDLGDFFAVAEDSELGTPADYISPAKDAEVATSDR
jgi:hypothetical protein